MQVENFPDGLVAGHYIVENLLRKDLVGHDVLEKLLIPGHLSLKGGGLFLVDLREDNVALLAAHETGEHAPALELGYINKESLR